MDPMTLSFVDEIEKISSSVGMRTASKDMIRKALKGLRKSKGGIKGALMSYGFTMGAAPVLGYIIGRAFAPKGEKESRKEVKKPESVIGHSLMPGYSEYIYGRKSVARDIIRKLDEQRKPKKEK